MSTQLKNISGWSSLEKSRLQTQIWESSAGDGISSPKVGWDHQGSESRFYKRDGGQELHGGHYRLRGQVGEGKLMRSQRGGGRQQELVGKADWGGAGRGRLCQTLQTGLVTCQSSGSWKCWHWALTSSTSADQERAHRKEKPGVVLVPCHPSLCFDVFLTKRKKAKKRKKDMNSLSLTQHILWKLSKTVWHVLRS